MFSAICLLLLASPNCAMYPDLNWLRQCAPLSGEPELYVRRILKRGSPLFVCDIVGLVESIVVTSQTKPPPNSALAFARKVVLRLSMDTKSRSKLMRRMSGIAQGSS